jgi:hypothetical protein
MNDNNYTPTDIDLTLPNGRVYETTTPWEEFSGHLPWDEEVILGYVTITENAFGTVIGSLSTTDADSGDVHSYSLSGVGSNLFEVDSSNQLKLKDGVSLDYETQSSYTLTVKSTDSGGLSRSEDFFVKVEDVPDGVLQYGDAGNNSFYGFTTGYTGIDGGDGVDTVFYNRYFDNGGCPTTGMSDSYSHYFFSYTSDNGVSKNLTYSHKSTTYFLGGGGFETIDSASLSNIERIQFDIVQTGCDYTLNGLAQYSVSNTFVYALDLDGNAGIAAKTIIATFGAYKLDLYMKPALNIVDGGTTLEGLCNLVVTNNLIENEIGSSTNGSFVDHVYENVVGTAPSSAVHDRYTALLDNGTHTKSSLLAYAANTTLTEDIMTANLVDLIGVPGSTDGEILVLKYDLGLG